ncbi:hypothetical protein AB1Y20_005286 [Prymnesium parvum]|uniref:Succinyl-CoA:3-ketoacid-coenzyme A transferase n=1 Tax=Prymnesium parvum TaxID=97485 RepID=A0AB34J463_PRYPA
MPRGLAQLVSAAHAVRVIPSGATVAIGGFIGAGHPEALTSALERRFLSEGAPSGLTLVYAAGQGDRMARGLNHLAHPRLLSRVVGGHWGLAPRLGRMALGGEVEAYNLPQGVICSLFREIAAKRPGVITKVGLNTFIDPLHGGGRLNHRAQEALVERVQMDGEVWLRYRSFPIHVGLIRATTADRHGNLSMEREALVGEVLPIAQAARNHGGVVIAQVERTVDVIHDPKAVRVPGILVDYVVQASPEEHTQTFGGAFNPSYVTNDGEPITIAPLPLSLRKIIGRRALALIRQGDVVNLGVGLPEAVVPAAAERGQLEQFALTVEAGPVGGAPSSGLDFGCSSSPQAVIDQPAQFDFYDGGGLDIAILGAAEVDEEGSVNVSVFGDRVAGVGGFVNIAQSAKRLVFCCAMRAGGLEVRRSGQSLHIAQEGKHPKFVKTFSKKQVCFHGPSAAAAGQEVIYVTERAVFRLTQDGLQLQEIAPGMCVNEHVISKMEFVPSVSTNLQTMQQSYFED